MSPLMWLFCSFLGVNVSQLDNIVWFPMTEENQVVADSGVLIQTHDGEEGIEDLVEDLSPFFSNRALWDCLVEDTSHE